MRINWAAAPTVWFEHQTQLLNHEEREGEKVRNSIDTLLWLRPYTTYVYMRKHSKTFINRVYVPFS